MKALSLEQWRKELKTIIHESSDSLQLQAGKILVIGCSTSEVAGKHIGTSGTMEVAEVIFTELKNYADERDFYLAFQCCEHLNRAIVVEKRIALEKGLEEVSVIPAPNAGGSMASYAYRQFEEPVVVEFIKADAGIDIGDTFIGMHLKHVAVPIRINQRKLGDAHVTLATTRPKLIGGARSIYEVGKLNIQC
ncbi:TIGR01440 family protein [Lederbergia wuyishanensis]|uniref:TIGR01440 family protein n=1 Tax=Lederbergia wuyishanensis TaxID=1347903 RepID=UPI001FD603E5|nr:TIGR01440 family protein [Lederbergia wuyishanensis]MCJ8007918.1 TIGR01440 family protein [Lederbergia wuyishanensis]